MPRRHHPAISFFNEWSDAREKEIKNLGVGVDSLYR